MARRKLGDTLVGWGVITPQQLEAALEGDVAADVHAVVDRAAELVGAPLGGAPLADVGAHAAGGEIVHPPMEIPGHGIFAIFIQGGIHHGLWQF